MTDNPHLTACCSDRSRHAAAGRWIRQVARLDCTGGRISPYRWQDNRHRECASGSITLQPAPARFSIEVAQNPVSRADPPTRITPELFQKQTEIGNAAV